MLSFPEALKQPRMCKSNQETCKKAHEEANHKRGEENLIGHHLPPVHVLPQFLQLEKNVSITFSKTRN
jgi:hypothetical protein